jgi:tetratricopeptide (TPR) repeat protein
MLLKWLRTSEANVIGTALADDVAVQTASGESGRPGRPAPKEKDLQKFLQRFLQQVDRETRPLQLNVLKRASLANSFKWRLLEKGVEPKLVDELTQALVVRLTTRTAEPSRSHEVKSTQAREPFVTAKRRPGRDAIQALLVRASEQDARGEYEQAIECYSEVLTADPNNVVACNALGLVFCRAGRYTEAGEQFRRAIKMKESFAEAHSNLGSLLRSIGQVRESEQPLRRALKLKPTLVEAQISLGATLSTLGRMSEARSLLEKALRVAPREVQALTSLGQLAALEGRFSEAEGLFKRVLEIDPKAPLAWIGLAGLRKLDSPDSAWLKGAQACADSGLAPLNEAGVRYAIARYHDQINEFAQAFRSVERAKQLAKTAAAPYSRAARSQFIDALIRTYTPAVLAGEKRGAADSSLPVLVTGMPRSGTSLIEQIIASHPAASGAGEMAFWGPTLSRQADSLLQGPPDEATRRKLAQAYLRLLTENSADAVRVVDKTPLNSEYLGLIYSIFPNARFIYLRRDPIDTCLSCYFQDFPPALNYTLDLSDLADFYREHHRIMEHWRRALPPGTLLDVPYEELIADQEGWTRRILEFIGLPWNDRCLSFHSADRAVLTASYWQVRQKLYGSSVGRWRNYRKFIGPLLSLRDTGS